MRYGIGIAIAALAYFQAATSSAGVSQQGSDWIVENEHLKVVVHSETTAFDVLDKRVGYLYRQIPRPGYVGKAKDITQQGDAVLLAFEHPRAAPDRKQGVQLTMKLQLEQADLLVELHVPPDTEISELHMPFPLVMDTSGANIISGYKEGVLYPVRDTSRFVGKPVAANMACFGAFDIEKGFGFLVILDTPYDYRAATQAFRTTAGKLLGVDITWLPQKGKMGYARRLIYHFSEKGGHTALAKCYRKHMLAEGVIVPFRRKKKQHLSHFPGVTDVHGGDEMVLRALKKIGVERALINTRDMMQTARELGYLVGRYDCYTDVLDPQFASESEKESAVCLGWKFPDDLCKNADGSWVPVGYRTIDTKTKRVKLRYRPCTHCALRVMKRDDRAKGEIERNNYGAYFLDVTTAERLLECYDPHHPMTRSEDAELRRQQFRFVAELDDGVIVGSEAGRDWALPYADYFEGIMSTTTWAFAEPALSSLGMHSKITPTDVFNEVGYGEKLRVPFWELVYHGAVVTTWWWGDNPTALPHTWQRRNLLNMLYGTMPIWLIRPGGLRSFFYCNLDRFAEAWRHVGPWNIATFYDELVSHNYLTSDLRAQRSDFSSGLSIIVNFGPEEFRTQDGKVMTPYSYLIVGDASKHPDLPIGKVVRVAPGWKPIDPIFEYNTFGGTSGWIAAKDLKMEHTVKDVRPNPDWERYQLTVSAMQKKGLPQVGSALIRGKIAGESFIVKTRKMLFLPHAEYEFRGWMNVKKIDKPDVPLLFAVATYDADGKPVARHESAPYDMSKKGKWQELRLRFTTASSVAVGCFEVPNPSGQAMQIEAGIDDIALEIKSFK